MISVSDAGISRLDRVTLCALPTPLVEATRLAQNLRGPLQGPRFLIKRDDLTGLAMGGNKSRACEFVMGQARACGHNVVIAVGPQHSNQLCAIAAAARKCGMRSVLLLLRGDNKVQGNLLLFRLLGAEIRFTDVDRENIEEAYDQMETLAKQLRNEGARPYKLKYGPLPTVGMAGYMLLLKEMLGQLSLDPPAEPSAASHHIFLGSGSGLTQAGLILGNRLLDGDCQIHGVILDKGVEQDKQERKVLDAIEAASALFGIDVPVSPDDVRCIPGYSGDDGATQEKSIEAIKLVARSEGLFLDPVYTARVMAAMIDEILAGRIGPQDTVVFYHSGGLPAIFSHCRPELF